jgi:RNA polymerase sigma factor (sigma-70 family)
MSTSNLDSDFRDAVGPHWEAMNRIALRMAPSRSHAEDILQDALALAWRTRKSYSADRGSVRTWLLVLTADQARKSRRKGYTPKEAVPRVVVESDGISEIRIDLERALDRLPARQKSAIFFYYYVGLPVQEVAGVMRCSEGTVKSTLSDARRNLQKILGDDYR